MFMFLTEIMKFIKRNYFIDSFRMYYLKSLTKFYLELFNKE